jgi:glyoxylase-like metal-dependent hydrolase (beta-lactamase superfamily II)
VEVEVERLGEHLYRLNSATYVYGSVNVVASVGEDGILLVDTGAPSTTKELAASLATLGEGEVRLVVNTHSHGGHVGGNTAFTETATVVAQARTREAMTTGRSLLLELPSRALPAVTFDEEVSIHFNGERIELRHLPYGHSTSDVIVHFTESKVICLGGLVYPDRFPLVESTLGCTPRDLAANLQSVIESSPADATFVTGYGRNYDREGLKAYHQMLVETIDIVEAALTRGEDVEEIKAAGILAEFESWARIMVTTDAWIEAIAQGSSPERTVPRKSLIVPLYEVLAAGGEIDAVIEEYRRLKSEAREDYQFEVGSLNAVGYYLLLKKGRHEDAIALFELNVEEYPEDFNTYDSLAEAHMMNGDREAAIRNYERSLELNPDNTNAVNMLRELRSE